MMLAVSILGLVYLAVIAGAIRHKRASGRLFAQGWFSMVQMKEKDCTRCDGVGYLWLQEYGNGTKLVKLPWYLRNEDPTDLPQVANLYVCEVCDGTGYLLTDAGHGEAGAMPIAWRPWRKTWG